HMRGLLGLDEVDQHGQEAVDRVRVLVVLGGEVVDRKREERPVREGMAVDDHEGRLCGVRHPASLTRTADMRFGGSVSESTRLPGMEWAMQRGLGALAEKMGIEFTVFTIERAVATMPVEGNTQPVGLVHGGAYVVL